MDFVPALTAINGIGAVPAQDRIITAAAIDRVLAGIAIDDVCAAAAADEVVAAEAFERVAFIAADDDVGAIGADGVARRRPILSMPMTFGETPSRSVAVSPADRLAQLGMRLVIEIDEHAARQRRIIDGRKAAAADIGLARRVDAHGHSAVGAVAVGIRRGIGERQVYEMRRCAIGREIDEIGRGMIQRTAQREDESRGIRVGP